jgi:hypothetical protein
MKTCRRCGVELVPGENWYPSQEKHSNYICKTCVKERWRDRYASESEFRERTARYQREWWERTKNNPEKKRRVYATRAAWVKRNPKRYSEIDNRSKVCKILRDHSEWLKDDPERLSTDFILSLVNDRGKNERDV